MPEQAPHVYCESLIMLYDVVLRSVAHTSHPPWPYHIWHNYPVLWSFGPLVFWSFGSSIRCRLSRSQEDGCVCFELRFDTTPSLSHPPTNGASTFDPQCHWWELLARIGADLFTDLYGGGFLCYGLQGVGSPSSPAIMVILSVAGLILHHQIRCFSNHLRTHPP